MPIYPYDDINPHGCTYTPSTDGGAWTRTDRHAPDITNGHPHTWTCIHLTPTDPDWGDVLPAVRCATCGLERCGDTGPNPCMWGYGHDEQWSQDSWCYRYEDYLADWHESRGGGADLAAVHQILVTLAPTYEGTWEELLETAWATAN